MNQQLVTALEFDLIKAQMESACAFSLGKNYLANLKPAFHYLKATKRLTLSQELLNLAIYQSGLDFSGVSDISEILNATLKDQTVEGRALLEVVTFNQAAARLSKSLPEVDFSLELVSDLLSSLYFDETLNHTILNKLEASGEVKSNATATLASLNNSRRNLENNIEKTLNQFKANHQSLLMEDIIVSRQNRQVLLLKATYKNQFPGIIHGESSSGQAVYFEPIALVNLNNDLSLVNEAIENEILKILFELSQAVKSVAPGLLANLETLAILDCFNAMSIWGKNRNAVIPTISENHELLIEAGRHPLIPEKQVVANTYRLSQPYQTILITGPNTGGKTVSLKVIGLFTLMAQSGMPVLAEQAILPQVDQIFLAIGDEQSVESSLSTFSAHLAKLAEIINAATTNSLVLLDELGGGTDPKEGESLAIAIIEYLRQQGCLTIVTTHLSGLKTYGLNQPDVLVASVEFDKTNLVPTYRYLEGSIGQSNALDIALRYGFKPEIIRSAKTILDNLKTSSEKELEGIEKTREILEKDKQLFEAEKIKLQELETKLNEEQSALEKRQSELALKEAELNYDLVNETSEIMEDLLRQMRQAQTKLDLKAGEKLLKQAKEKLKATKLPTKPLAVGDLVNYKNSNHIGEIISINKDKVQIILNKLTLSVPLKDLTLAEVPKPQKQAKRSSIKVPTSKAINLELNIVGYKVAEALPVLGKHLDDCLLNNITTTKIIHGVGTGQLKQAVWDYLATFPFVKHYQSGDYHDGGLGVTIVQLGG